MSTLNVRCFDKNGVEVDVSSYQLDEQITNELSKVLTERVTTYEEERERLTHQVS